MGYFPRFTPMIPSFTTPFKAANDSVAADGAETYEQKQKRLAEEAQKRQEEALKKIKLDTLKIQYQEVVDTVAKTVTQTEKEQAKFKKSIKKDGSAVQDSGAKGIVRWGANAWTALKNAWQGLKGYDKNGNWSGERLFWNCVGVAAGIGICCIPGGAFALAAFGVAGAVIGGVGAAINLNDAEKTGNQQKIDEAQQDICMNTIVGLTSIFGSGVIGRLFRTSSSTAEVASVAASRTNWAMKPIEWISNFGKDATVNAWKSAKYAVKDANKNGWMNATKANFRNMTSGTFNWGKTKFDAKSAKYQETVSTKLQQVEQKLTTETDAGKRALLMEEKEFLEENLADHASIGSTVKSKADFDKLSKDNMAKFNKDYVRNGYTKNAAGEYEVRGTVVKEEDLLAFQQRVFKQQQALANELENLIKAKANMMRWRSNWFNRKQYTSELAEYVDASGAKRKLYKPSTWLKTKEQIAIDGKNPSYMLKTFGTLLTTSALMPAKASEAWINPIYTNPEFVTVAMLPEQVQSIIQSTEEILNVYKQILESMQTAKTEEEFKNALGTYEQLVAMQQQGATQQQEAASQTAEATATAAAQPESAPEEQTSAA